MVWVMESLTAVPLRSSSGYTFFHDAPAVHWLWQ